MSQDAYDFYLPNAHNCIQSALFQLTIGNQEQAIRFLESAQRSLAQVKSSEGKSALNPYRGS